MLTRRTLLLSGVSGAVVSVAGCSLLGDEIEAEASPARVDDTTLTETGYEHLRTDDSVLEQTVQVENTERQVSITNWMSEYGTVGTADEQSAAHFLVFTSPTVGIAGRSVNPFDRYNEKRLIRDLASGSERGEPAELEEVGTETVETLGVSVEFTVYRTTQEVAGESVDLLLHFASLTNDGDLVAILGTHPEILDESENMYRLAGGIEHPTEP